MDLQDVSRQFFTTTFTRIVLPHLLYSHACMPPSGLFTTLRWMHAGAVPPAVICAGAACAGAAPPTTPASTRAVAPRMVVPCFLSMCTPFCPVPKGVHLLRQQGTTILGMCTPFCPVPCARVVVATEVT